MFKALFKPLLEELRPVMVVGDVPHDVEAAHVHRADDHDGKDAHYHYDSLEDVCVHHCLHASLETALICIIGIVIVVGDTGIVGTVIVIIVYDLLFFLFYYHDHYYDHFYLFFS